MGELAPPTRVIPGAVGQACQVEVGGEIIAAQHQNLFEMSAGAVCPAEAKTRPARDLVPDSGYGLDWIFEQRSHGFAHKGDSASGQKIRISLLGRKALNTVCLLYRWQEGSVADLARVIAPSTGLANHSAISTEIRFMMLQTDLGSLGLAQVFQGLVLMGAAGRFEGLSSGERGVFYCEQGIRTRCCGEEIIPDWGVNMLIRGGERVLDLVCGESLGRLAAPTPVLATGCGEWVLCFYDSDAERGLGRSAVGIVYEFWDAVRSRRTADCRPGPVLSRGSR